MDPLAPLVHNLHSEGRLRVWSLVITVFGDCVQHRGGRIATARLGALLGRVGVETGALRTALSRLSRDGWVESHRAGRTSSYALTRAGRDRFVPATAQIYARPRRGPVEAWDFATGDKVRGLALQGGVVRPAEQVRDPQAQTLMTGQLGPFAAQAIRDRLAPDHVEALRGLAADLGIFAALPDPLPPRDAAAARVVLVHRWRRLVLRWPELPAEIMPDDITPADLHGAVAAAYHRLAPQAEAWLGSADGDLEPMPIATQDVTARFGGAQGA